MRFLKKGTCCWRNLALILLLWLGLSLIVTPAWAGESKTEPESKTEGRGVEGAGVVKGERRKAIFETPYLCRLGKRYPWIRTFVDERLHLYGSHIEWRETGGNPRLIVFDKENGIKSLIHFKDEHKDVESIIRDKLEL